jgi:hypothetical protein
MFRNGVYILILLGFLVSQMAGAFAVPADARAACSLPQEQISIDIYEDVLDADSLGSPVDDIANECNADALMHCGAGACLILPTNARNLFVVHETGFGQNLLPDLRPPRV